MSNNTKETLFSSHIQKSNDLTLDDLNRYLPALRKVDDFTFENYTPDPHIKAPIAV